MPLGNMKITKQQKYIIITLVILIILAIIATIYASYRKQTAQGQNVTPATVFNIKAQNPALDLDTKTMVYYDLGQLDLFRVDLSTGVKTRLSNNMDQPDSILWSPDRTQAIIKIQYDKYKFEKFGSPFADTDIPDQATTIWNYNLQTQKYILLDPNIYSPVALNPTNPIWTSDSKKIIYYLVDQNTNSSTLAIANSDGGNAQNLGNVPLEMYSILGYDDQSNTVIYNNYSTDTNLYGIVTLNLKSQKTDEIVSDVSSVLPIDSTKFVYTKDKSSYLYNLTNQSQNKFQVVTTDRNTFLSNNSKELLTRTLINGKENIYIIDLSSLKTVNDFDPGLANTNITNLMLGDDNKTLYFTADNKLYKISF